MRSTTATSMTASSSPRATEHPSLRSSPKGPSTRTRSVRYDNRDWLSRELAAVVNPMERITLKQLLDPGVVYAFGDFMARSGQGGPRRS